MPSDLVALADKDTGNPLPATNIVVAGTKQGAAADASGQFWILIETGTYDLQISRIGYQTVAIKGVEVKPEQTTQVNPLLKAAVIEVGMGEEIPPPPPPPSADSKDEFVFVAYDKPPVPIGGFKAIQQHLVYPEIARKAGIEGKVVVLIQISEKGKVVKTKIEESLGPNGCDEAAVNALKSVEWKPAMQRDLPVAVWVAVPVDFRLTSEKPGK